ncbi:TonB-dependent receptor [Edaphobacter modestus]|uniref:Carboxypeptidase family protein n=1 Tax=Edaphobacter modestus TaxID=388466 RepID=A0A4Q7YY93_9BACT|nr:TonB-dependent receptor [Edaphobacter modestus]RZU42444.1 carboxypeptidase family protein [Edaphobacter modestus]
MRVLRLVILCSLALCFAALGRCLWAQSTTGSVVGSISDSTGSVIPNATITLTNNATGEKRTVITTDSGDYQLLSILPGRYTLTVEAQGFRRYSHDPVEVQVDLATRENVEMTVGSATEQITVTSQAPIIQTENAALGQVVSGKAVTDIPLNGRNVLALVGLVPGVVPQGSSSGNLTGQNVFAAGNYQIGGGSANQSATLYDGAPVNISYGNITALVPSQDTVQEFRVQTNNNTAEFGNYTGGVINIASKSGSNAIHGTVYEFVRNTIFNTTPYFAKHNPNQVLGKNPYHQNQFGANVGFPIIKDRLFGFFDYQGYRQSQQRLYNYTVPTLKMRQGDFSELCTLNPATNLCTGNPASTATAGQIYDPCGGSVAGGQGCPGYTGQRTPYAGNVIPAARWSAVARNLLNFPYWAAPTGPGVTNNFVRYAGSGGKNDQYNGRVDFTLSDKQRIFGRYTQWNSKNQGSMPYNNGLISGDPISPEAFKTYQTVIGDTYLFNPTLIGDLRLSFTRWNYVRTPGTLGYDETQLGFPSYMGTISDLNRVPNSTTVPGIALSNPTVNGIGTGYIFSINNNYVIAPNVTKTFKGHTIKAGADLRRLEMSYFQNNSPGGSFQFNPFMSSFGNNAAGGHPFASFLMGYMVDQASTASVVQIAPPTYSTMYYQGYFVQDNWMVNSKLTLNIGLRYEIPGVWRERNQLMATFNPTEVNPVLGNVSINGRAITGAYDLVNSPQHPDKGLRGENFSNFSPRLGLAFRPDDKTVIRAGWGKFVIPAYLQFPESPVQSPLSYITNNPVSTLDSGLTPNATLDNPLPSGITPAPGRDPKYQQLLLGGSANALQASEDNGATYQWNFAIQRQLPLGIALEAAYSGLHGSHLPLSRSINQVSQQYLNQALTDSNCVGPTANLNSNCFLTRRVANPFNRSLFSQGNQQYATVQATQLYRPYPQYGAISNTGNYVGVSNYSSLQMKVEKRFSSGGVLLGSYTFSKLMANVESLTSWLEATGAPGYQNMNDLSQEYSLSGYDSRQRLTVSYVYFLPFGKNQHWGSGVSGFLGGLISGYGVNGVTTFQKGFPLGFSMAQNTVSTYALAGTTRPNIVQGCAKATSGSIQSRLGDSSSNFKRMYDPACFQAPGNFRFGNESRTDNQLRAPGIANYDLALFKDTHLTERLVLQLRVESFNLFNRVQFGAPNTSIGSAQMGQITTQVNDPRLLQLAGRINF